LTSGPNDWHADLKIVALLAAIQPEERTLQERITRLYEAIRDHDWNTVYGMRTDEFRRSVSFELFLGAAKALDYTFTGYEVLRHDSYHIPGKPEKRRFMVRFQINGRERFNVVWWVRERDIWKVENLGLEIPSFPFDRSFDRPSE
jgi:hypothetical protein